MKLTTKILILCAAAALPQTAAFAQPAVAAVLNGASYGAAMAPGSWIAVFGSDFATVPATASSLPLPASLGGVSVNIGALAAPILYASSHQLNVLIPAGVVIPADTVVPLTVTSPSGTSAPYYLRLTRNAPAIFTRDGSGKGRALVFDPNFNPAQNVGAKDNIVLYAAGLGPTDASGKLIDSVEVDIGERPAQVTFAGLAPGIPGVYQLNVTAPVPATDRLFLRVGGWQSNITTVSIRGGSNALNVTGTIDGVYPSSDPIFNLPPCLEDPSPVSCGGLQDLSVMLHVGTFTVGFDLAASAVPFDVAAVGEAGASVISIDPLAHTFTAAVSTVTQAAAIGDFSQSTFTLWDFETCSTNLACFQFPGPNILPFSRLNPLWFQAVRMLPQTNTVVPPGPNAVFQASGTFSGTHFVVDAQNNAGLSKFGGFIQVPLGPFERGASSFKLYVDGKLVTSKDLTYSVVHR